MYDDANRVQSVNGVTYTFNANGNLLSDGTNTYTYDSANRLTSISGGTSATFTYNGLGDRLTQNGVNYTLDLNTGLTQVLNDGTNSYVYGTGRIAQVNTTTEYFLGDALGSVRQLTDASGTVTLAKSYDPYGTVSQSVGSGASVYAYTGEQQDASGLTYLRARYYSSGNGRFLTRDTWMGDAYMPITYNKWTYANANPIMYTDPSGKNPACTFGSLICARQRLDNIILNANNNGALALVMSFEDSELYSSWGDIAGKTSRDRLDWLLDTTQNVAGIPLHFGISFGSDCGFRDEFMDSKFYEIWYGNTNTNQVGHFLTAVSISNKRWDIFDTGWLIGHEQWPDGNRVGAPSWYRDRNNFSFLFVTIPQIASFDEAASYDEQHLYDKRDDILFRLLNRYDTNIPYDGYVEQRDGNSLQDLRLSLKGYRFAKWIRENGNTHPSFAASWLRSNLMTPLTMPRPPR